jgi:PAS domain S-box-containing protein
VALLNNNDYFIRVNEVLCNLTGYTPEELCSLKFGDLVHPQEKSKGLEAWGSLNRGGGQSTEIPLVHQQGHMIWAQVSCTSLELETEPAAYKVVQFYDLTKLKQTEDSLRQNEATLRGLLQAAPMVIGLVKDRILGWTNEAIFNLTGYSSQELYGQSARMLYESDEEFQRVAEVKHPLVQKFGTGSVETRFKHKDGTLVDILLSSAALDPQDLSQGLVFTATDISGLKKAEQALKESEHRYRALFETMTQGVVYQDANGAITSANPTAQKILGLNLEQLRGRTSADPRWQAIKEDGTPFAGEEHPSMTALRTGKPVSDVVMGIYSPVQSERRWISISAVPEFRQGEKKAFRVYTTFTDITENKKAEEALRFSEEKFSKAFQASPVWVVLSSLHDGRYLEVNETFLKMTGFSRKEVIGRTSLELGTWVDTRERDHIVAEILRTGSISNFEVRRRTKSGDQLTMLFSGETVEVGGKKRLLSVSMDITERKMAEEERRKMQAQVQQVQKLESLGILAGGIAHDFNNLLMGVMGNAGLALMELPPESPPTSYVKQIEATARRLAELTNQLLAYSGKGKFLTSHIDLSNLVRELAGLLKTVVSKKATLRYDYDEDIPAIEADPTQIRQVVMNLITNASDALEDKEGLISVRTGTLQADNTYLEETYLREELPPGLYAYVEVSDTGVGMDSQTKAKIFDPFFTTKFAGRGLGLAAVLGIVRGHQGAVKIYSEPGQGTTFKVLFPASSQPAQDLPSEPVKICPTEKCRTILVADDEATVREVARRTLEGAGCEVITASDGQQAIDTFRAKHQQIDLVLLDMTMPRKGGEEVFREIRSIDPHIPVILTSGYSEQDTANHFIGRGLSGFIQKPYVPNELIQKIRNVLSKKK